MNGLHRYPPVINQVKATLWTAFIDAPPHPPRTINQDKATVWIAFTDTPQIINQDKAILWTASGMPQND